MLGFSRRLATVPGDRMSANMRWSSSITQTVPLGERLGVPSAQTVATNPRRCCSTTRFMSSVKTCMSKQELSDRAVGRVYSATVTTAPCLRLHTQAGSPEDLVPPRDVELHDRRQLFRRAAHRLYRGIEQTFARVARLEMFDDDAIQPFDDRRRRSSRCDTPSLAAVS